MASASRVEWVARFAWLTLAYDVGVIVWGAYVRATGSGRLRQPLAPVRCQHPASSATTANSDRIFAPGNKRLGAGSGGLSPSQVLAQDLQRRLAALLGPPRDYPPI